MLPELYLLDGCTRQNEAGQLTSDSSDSESPVLPETVLEARKRQCQSKKGPVVIEIEDSEGEGERPGKPLRKR